MKRKNSEGSAAGEITNPSKKRSVNKAEVEIAAEGAITNDAVDVVQLPPVTKTKVKSTERIEAFKKMFVAQQAQRAADFEQLTEQPEKALSGPSLGAGASSIADAAKSALAQRRANAGAATSGPPDGDCISREEHLRVLEELRKSLAREHGDATLKMTNEFQAASANAIPFGRRKELPEKELPSAASSKEKVCPQKETDVVTHLSLRVFVANIPYDYEEDSLKRDFRECGHYSEFLYPTDGKGNHRGIAFITFREMLGVRNALSKDGALCGDKKIEVKLSKSKRIGRVERAKGKRKGKPVCLSAW